MCTDFLRKSRKGVEPHFGNDVVSKVDLYLMYTSEKLKCFLFSETDFFADPAGKSSKVGNIV